MVTLEFEKNELGDGIVTVVVPNSHLVDICDSIKAPVAFSCRTSSCGTCRVEVLEGQQFLEPPKDEELDLLDIFRSPPNHRLACQAVVKHGDGRLRLRWVDDL